MKPIRFALLIALAVRAPAQVPVQTMRASAADQSSTLRVEVGRGEAPMPPSSPVDVPPALLPGWPKVITAHPNFSPVRGVTFADLDRDGVQEIIASSTAGLVHVWDVAGTALPGWPRVTVGFPQYPAAVGDLDGDGIPEVVQTTRGLTSGGRLYVFRADGSDYPGYPLSFNNNNIEYTAALADLDFDGQLELIVGERAWPIGRLHVLRAGGTPFPGAWPVTLDHVPALSASVADLDGDGAPEIVYGSYNSLYVFRADGSLLPGWPYNVSTRHGANFSYQSPALADLDGDGRLEIVTACHQSGSGCYVFRADGTLLTGWPKSFGGNWSYSPPTVCDLEGDGAREVLCGIAGGTASGAQVYAWTGAGVLKPGFPRVGPGGAEGPLVVADLDPTLPGREIVYDSNLLETATGQGWLWATDALGVTLPGWPLRPMGFTYMNAGTLGDLDGDGRPEVATITRDSGTTSYVYVWRVDAPFAPGMTDWWCYHESIQRTGRAGKGHRNQELGPVVVGGSFTAWLKGAVGGSGVLFLGFGPAAIPVPPAGVLQLNPALPMIPLFVGALPAGEAMLRLGVPNSPAVRGATLYFQGAEWTTPASLSLTDMRSVVIR